MNNFLWALKFLTIIPLDMDDRIKPGGRGSVVLWFPVVGLCIGVFLSLVYLLFNSFFPLIVADALIMLVYIAVTGALHLDGLADTCDGIWGGWNREKRLEIMRDSRIGGFGAIGLICVLGIKYISLVSIGGVHFADNSPFSNSVKCISCFIAPVLVSKCIALMVMPVIGRWAQVCAAGLSKYARNEPGTGSFVLEGTTPKRIICTSIVPLFLFWYFYNVSGFIIFAIIIIFTLIWIWYIKRKIGGMTGDTLGATNEVAEILFLLSLLLLN